MPKGPILPSKFAAVIFLWVHLKGRFHKSLVCSAVTRYFCSTSNLAKGHVNEELAARVVFLTFVSEEQSDTQMSIWCFGHLCLKGACYRTLQNAFILAVRRLHDDLRFLFENSRAICEVEFT